MAKRTYLLARLLIKDSFLNSLAFVLFVLLTLKSVLNPCIPWDSWAYHLPFSSYIWNIGGGIGNFEPGVYFRSIYHGFPLLGEFLQGACWKIFGTLQALTLPHIILFLVFLYAAGKVLEIKRSLLFFAFMGCPMLVLTYMATYIDLLASLCIALAFIMGIQFLLAASAGKPWLSSFGLFAFFEIVAANIKYQTYFSAVLLLAIFTLAPWFLQRVSVRVRFYIFSLAIGTGILMSGNEIKNLIFYDDPFYPIEVTAAGHELFAGPLKGNPPAADYPIKSGPLSFALSATELDWSIRYLRVFYDISNDTGDNAVRYGPERTGGWGQGFVMVNGILILLQVFRWPRLEPSQRICFGCFLVFLLATSFMPRCTELRYYLSVPLLAILVNLRFVLREASRDIIVISLITLMIYSFVFVYNDPQEQTANFVPTNYAADLPPKYINDSPVSKVVYDYHPDSTPFRYARAVTGQNVVIRVLYKNKDDYEENYFPYEPGNIISFGQSNPEWNEGIYFSGFSIRNAGNISMLNARAAVRLLMPEPKANSTLTLRMEGDPNINTNQDIVVYANQTEIGHITPTNKANDYSLSIPKGTVSNNGKLSLEFEAKNNQGKSPGINIYSLEIK